MKNNEIISMHDLQLFAEGGAAGGTAAGTGAGGTGVNAPAAGVQGVEASPNTGDGAPSPEVQNQTVQPTAADLDAEFNALIKGKYKDQYNARVKATVQKRLRGPSEVAEKYKTLEPGLQLLARRYGIEDASDAKSLLQAIQSDNSLIEDVAMESGMDAAAYRRLVAAETENAAHRQREAEERRQQEAQRQYETWMKQAEAAKLKYPNLDLATEIQDPRFLDLLRANVDVAAAYTVIHQDDIISGAMAAAVQNASQKIVNSVAAGAARPNENGSGHGAATVKPDVSKMTKAQREDFIRRAARGERITFRP